MLQIRPACFETRPSGALSMRFYVNGAKKPLILRRLAQRGLEGRKSGEPAAGLDAHWLAVSPVKT
jgi:hypothetical protein